jgi:FkbM family methyltransferase
VTFRSYAQNGEDVVLWRTLRRFTPGFYIDVGASDPVIDSVTNAFARAGWSGINIEPMAGPFERLVADRPHDINLNVALEDFEATRNYFSIGDESGLSTGVEESAATFRADGWQIREIPVSVTTLARVCEEQVRSDIHFLKIDVEGKEAGVLRGADFTRFRPFVVVVESIAPQQMVDARSGRPLDVDPLPPSTHVGWEGILIDAGYRFCLFDGVNRFYVADEHATELGPLLSVPANVLDDAVPSALADARATAASRSLEIDAVRAQRDAADAEIRAMRTTLSWKITQPLRAVRRVFGPSNHRRDR